MYIMALHTIMRDANAVPPVISAQTVFDPAEVGMSDKSLERLFILNAARAATEDEIKGAGFGVAKKTAAEAAAKDAAKDGSKKGNSKKNDDESLV